MDPLVTRNLAFSLMQSNVENQRSWSTEVGGSRWWRVHVELRLSDTAFTPHRPRHFRARMACFLPGWCTKILPSWNTHSFCFTRSMIGYVVAVICSWAQHTTEWRQPCSHRMLFTSIRSSLELSLLIPDLACLFWKLCPFPQVADHFFTTELRGRAPQCWQRDIQ